MYRFLKIAHVVSTFPPYQGGMGNVTYHLADGLANLKYDVTVFTPKRKFFDDDLESYFIINKLLPAVRFGNAAVVWQLAWYLLPYQVVHFHYPFLGACVPIIFLKLLKRRKQKLILHYHMDLVGQGWRWIIYQFYNYFFLPLLVKLSDKVIVTSEDYLNHCLLTKFKYVYLNKFAIIPNGVDIEFLFSRPDPLLDGNPCGNPPLNGSSERFIVFILPIFTTRSMIGIGHGPRVRCGISQICGVADLRRCFARSLPAKSQTRSLPIT